MKKTAWIFFLLCMIWAVPAFAEDYAIGVGDLLSVRVWGEDSLSADVRVRPDGKISLPGVGDIQAEGVTPASLQRSVAGRLSAIVYEPMVTVMVHAANNNSVVVYGPGVKSGIFLLERKTTLLQLLAQVSPDYAADLRNARLERGNGVVSQNFYDLYVNGRTESDVILQSGDRVFIPLREDRHVFVTGAVATPATLPYYEGMTLLEAVNLAGGFTKFADRNHTQVVRENAQGRQVIPVRAGDLADKGDLSQNILLQGGDLVQVKKGWF